VLTCQCQRPAVRPVVADPLAQAMGHRLACGIRRGKKARGTAGEGPTARCG
jgi:hypothetical protein